MLKNICLLLSFFILSYAEATDLKPWFGKDYEVELRASLLYQNYNKVSIPHHRSFNRNENDGFAELSAAYPFKKYCCEFEVIAANTKHQNCRWDNFRLTGRYQCFDEQEGSPFSVVVGFTFIQALSRAVHDISSFHHGHFEGEFTLSIGKKYGFLETDSYQQRWWNVIGVGNSDIGSAWLRDYFAWEYNYADVHQFRGFINAQLGTGKDNLDPCCFNGYGHIAHRSVDVGIRYGYSFNCWGTLSLQYARRVYAYNFPANANLVLLEYYLPFGFQSSCNY